MEQSLRSILAPATPHARGGTRPVPAVDRAARILQTLAGTDLRLTDITRALRLPKSTALAILRTLHQHRLVGLDSASGRYHLGPGLLSLAGAAQTWSDLRRVARPVVERLAQQTGETVIVHVPDGAASIIVDRVESPHQLRVTAPLGLRLPPLAGAVGKVMLAALPAEAAARRLARHTLPAFTPRSITSRTVYLRALEQVRRQGFATDDEEYLPGVRAVTAPIFDARGQLLATLSVVAVRSRSPDRRLRQIGQWVRAAAAEISLAFAAPPAPGGAGRQTEIGVVPRTSPRRRAARG